MTTENKSWADDVAKLLLRLAVGGLMLFHGVQKIRHGVDFMNPLLEAKGLPTFFAYGSYLGEVVAPLLILVGVLTRLASLVVAGTMVMAVYLALSNQVLTLNQFGGWAIELNAFFFLTALALALLGPGRFGVWQARTWWLK
jgi:putative oxidoreductase